MHLLMPRTVPLRRRHPLPSRDGGVRPRPTAAAVFVRGPLLPQSRCAVELSAAATVGDLRHAAAEIAHVSPSQLILTYAGRVLERDELALADAGIGPEANIDIDHQQGEYALCYTAYGAYALLTPQGRVLTWGAARYGGDAGAAAARLRGGVAGRRRVCPRHLWRVLCRQGRRQRGGAV